MSCSWTSVDAVFAELGLPDSSVLLDARNDAELGSQPRLVPGALRAPYEHVQQWSRALPRTRPIVAYSSDGGGASVLLADALTTMGYPATALEGGMEAWMRAGYPTIRARSEFNVPGGSRWVTRERPKIDRLACPWLVRRFIDPRAAFFYAPAHQVRSESQALRAEPYDIPDVLFSHRGPRCSFDAFLEEFDLHDTVLDRLAAIVRAADTDELAQSPEAAGLLAISLGLSANIADDIVLLQQAMPLYDALYAWCKKAHRETHSWPQKTTRS